MKKLELVSPGRRGNRAARLCGMVKGPGPLQRYLVQIRATVAPLRRKGVSLRQCCAVLNEKKLFSFRGHPWKVPRLSQVLHGKS